MFSVYNEDESLDWSNIGIIAAVVVAIIVVIVLAAKPTSWESKFTLSAGKDIPGGDIQCFTEGQDAKFCGEKCLADPNCKSTVYVKQGNPWWGGKYGCCIKHINTPVNPLGPEIDAYVRK